MTTLNQVLSKALSPLLPDVLAQEKKLRVVMVVEAEVNVVLHCIKCNLNAVVVADSGKLRLFFIKSVGGKKIPKNDTNRACPKKCNISVLCIWGLIKSPLTEPQPPCVHVPYTYYMADDSICGCFGYVFVQLREKNYRNHVIFCSRMILLTNRCEPYTMYTSYT